jgi:alkanesulfonate monooxygenase SsuD/methylene tetrahydromethanopterin reductase-like flavin-dependent oxidoreductase (luciferase family)
MKIGIGLPNTVPGTTGTELMEWARRAESGGFAFVSAVDRVAYPSFDVLTTLAAVCGATSRLELLTNALLAPTYPVLPLAKSTATLAQLSGGRLTLGLGIGTRDVDYETSGGSFRTRGRTFDRQLEVLHRAWQGEPVGSGRPVGPVAPGGRVPVLIGGYGEHAIRRAVRWGAGWTGAGGGLDRSAPMVRAVRDAWQEAHRDGEPRLVGLVYFSLGHDAESDAYLRDYYGYDPSLAEKVAAAALRRPDEIRRAIGAFAESGFNELVFTPTLSSLDQVDQLADLVHR